MTTAVHRGQLLVSWWLVLGWLLTWLYKSDAVIPGESSRSFYQSWSRCISIHVYPSQWMGITVFDTWVYSALHGRETWALTALILTAPTLKWQINDPMDLSSQAKWWNFHWILGQVGIQEVATALRMMWTCHLILILYPVYHQCSMFKSVWETKIDMVRFC